MYSSHTIDFQALSLEIAEWSLIKNTLSISSFSDGSKNSMFLYISATPEQFRLISEKCLEFAEKLEKLEKEKQQIKEDAAA